MAVAQTTPLSDYFKGSNGKPGKLQAPAARVPQWLKDSRKLNDMLGSDAKVRIENPKVVHKVSKVFASLDAFVVEGTEFSDDHPDGKQQLYFFYSDAAQEYLFVGMAIDMKRGRDVSMDLERYLRGQLAESPAGAAPRGDAQHRHARWEDRRPTPHICGRSGAASWEGQLPECGADAQVAHGLVMLPFTDEFIMVTGAVCRYGDILTAMS